MSHAHAAFNSYDDAADSRLYEGYEERGVTGDLWGVNNLFTYSPEGTSLQRVSLFSAIALSGRKGSSHSRHPGRETGI